MMLSQGTLLPGRGSSYLPPPPQTPACGIPAQGSSVPTLLTKLETHQATPRWAHSWATLSPVSGSTLRRLVGSMSFPSFLPATRYTRPRLPSSGSLGSHFPTFIGTMLGYDCQLSFSMPYASRSVIDTLLAPLRLCPFLKLVSEMELRTNAWPAWSTGTPLPVLFTRKHLALPSSQATLLNSCPALRPRWCPAHSP
jgi:hypothetical protein